VDAHMYSGRLEPLFRLAGQPAMTCGCCGGSDREVYRVELLGIPLQMKR